jgi:hypothetical protein
MLWAILRDKTHEGVYCGQPLIAGCDNDLAGLFEVRSLTVIATSVVSAAITYTSNSAFPIATLQSIFWLGESLPPIFQTSLRAPVLGHTGLCG